MKNKKIIIILLLISLFTFSGCFDKKNENKENNESKTNTENIENKNEENNKNEEKQEIISLTDEKNYSYVRTIDLYVNMIKNAIVTGKYSIDNTKTLYLFPVGKGGFIAENKDTSPYSNEWKYIFIGVTYDSSIYSYYVLALDGKNIGTDFTSYKTLELESIEQLKEISAYKELYNLTNNKTYSLNEMNSELKDLVNSTGSNQIIVFVK